MSEIEAASGQEANKDHIVNGDDLKTLLEEERKKRSAAEAENKKFSDEAAKERRLRTDAEARASNSDQARQRAERNATDATSRVASEVDARYRAQEDSIAAQMEAADAEAERLEGEIVALQEEGKWSDAAKLTRQLGSAGARSENLKMAKQDIEDAKARVKAKATERQVDPLASFSANARQWIGAHPRYMTDQQYQEKVIAAHYAAKTAGHTVDSPAYFQAIEEHIGEREPQAREQTAREAAIETPPKKPAKETQEVEVEQETERSAPVVAVQRRSQADGGQRAGEIRLSAAEKEHADISMPDIDENDHVDPKTGLMVPGRYRMYHERKQKNREDDRFLLPSSR